MINLCGKLRIDFQSSIVDTSDISKERNITMAASHKPIATIYKDTEKRECKICGAPTTKHCKYDVMIHDQNKLGNEARYLDQDHSVVL